MTMAKQNENKTGITIEVKEMFVGLLLVMLCGMFMLGWTANSKVEEKATFTYQDVQTIENFQQQLISEYGEDVTVIATKSKDGNLTLSWE
jgi:type II secretory pathway pseudopilin PulG